MKIENIDAPPIDLRALAIKAPKPPKKRRGPGRPRRPGAHLPRRRLLYATQLAFSLPLQGVGLSGLIALTMTPGEWHSFRDVRAVSPGLKRTSLTGRLRFMVLWGLLERVDFPDRVETTYQKGLRIDRTPRGDPLYLYRLTPAGERLRRRASVLV